MAQLEMSEKEIKAAAPSIKSKRKGGDKWKTKKWYKVFAPKQFNEVEIAQTPASEPESLMGRMINVSARDLTGNIKKNQLMVQFRVNDVQGLNARTQLHAILAQAQSMKRLVRRRSTKVESSGNVICQDGSRLRVKTFALCVNAVPRAAQTALRKILNQGMVEWAREFPREEFLKEIVLSERVNQIQKDCTKIAPLKRVDVVKAVPLA